MKIGALIKGLQILARYRTNGLEGYDIGAGHNVLYAYPTDRPVAEDDLKRLIELNWFQEGVDTCGCEFGVEHYSPEESWAHFT